MIFYRSPNREKYRYPPGVSQFQIQQTFNSFNTEEKKLSGHLLPPLHIPTHPPHMGLSLIPAWRRPLQRGELRSLSSLSTLSHYLHIITWSVLKFRTTFTNVNNGFKSISLHCCDDKKKKKKKEKCHGLKYWP